MKSLTLALTVGMLISGSALAGVPGPELMILGMQPLHGDPSCAVPGDTIVPVGFFGNGLTVTAVAFSLDLDLDLVAFDETDGDMDGIPDAVQFPLGEPGLVVAQFDAADQDGELDLLFANLSGVPFADGVLVEIVLQSACGGTVAEGIRGFSADPPASFGNAQGESVPGFVTFELFHDGFESGDTSAWLSSAGLL